MSGWTTVEVVRGFCEVGEGCVKSCPYSYPKKLAAKADKVYKEYCEELAKQTN
jgi:hypothetical protein